MARLCGHFPFVHCHTERSEEFKVREWRMRNDLRFFTPLRCVQNNSMEMAVFRTSELTYFSGLKGLVYQMSTEPSHELVTHSLRY